MHNITQNALLDALGCARPVNMLLVCGEVPIALIYVVASQIPNNCVQLAGDNSELGDERRDDESVNLPSSLLHGREACALVSKVRTGVGAE